MTKGPVPWRKERLLWAPRGSPSELWIRKLSRRLGALLSTVYTYIRRKGYCGRFVKIKKTPSDRPIVILKKSKRRIKSG